MFRKTLDFLPLSHIPDTSFPSHFSIRAIQTPTLKMEVVYFSETSEHMSSTRCVKTREDRRPVNNCRVSLNTLIIFARRLMLVGLSNKGGLDGPGM